MLKEILEGLTLNEEVANKDTIEFVNLMLTDGDLFDYMREEVSIVKNGSIKQSASKITRFMKELNITFKGNIKNVQDGWVFAQLERGMSSDKVDFKKDYSDAL